MSIRLKILIHKIEKMSHEEKLNMLINIQNNNTYNLSFSNKIFIRRYNKLSYDEQKIIRRQLKNTDEQYKHTVSNKYYAVAAQGYIADTPRSTSAQIPVHIQSPISTKVQVYASPPAPKNQSKKIAERMMEIKQDPYV